MQAIDKLTYDKISVGYEFPAVHYEVTKEQVVKYVEAVEDFNPLYVDEGFARGSKYGELIAPPAIAATFTTLRVVLGGVKMPPGTIHAKQYFKFIKAIKPGDNLSIKVKLADKFIRRDKNYVVIESRVRNERAEDVVMARLTGIWPR